MRAADENLSSEVRSWAVFIGCSIPGKDTTVAKGQILFLRLVYVEYNYFILLATSLGYEIHLK